MSNRIKVFTPNASNQVKIVQGEQTTVKVISTGPQGPPGPSSTFIGGNIENDVEVSGSFTFLGTSGPKPQSFIKIDEGMTVTGSHYSASIQHTASFGRLEIAGDSLLQGNVTIGGNISIGDANTDSLTISSDLSSSIIPDIDGTFDLGTTTKNWKFGYIEQVTSTHVTASGNISGSATSTGSFGRVETSVIGGLSPLRVESDNFKVDANGSITFSGNISGSSTTTGSFDNLRVSGLSVPDIKVMSSSLSSRITEDSSSISTRITNATASIAGLKTDSGSFSTRITNATSSIAGLKTDSGSFSTRITNATASIAGLKTDSGSFSTRITNATASIAGLKTDSGSFSSRITNDSSSISTRLTTEESNVDTLQSRVGQSLNVSDAPTFGGLTIQGTLTAQNYVISSSITTMSIAQSSGSTIFGDTQDDTHEFTGSLNITGSVSALNYSGIFNGALSSSAQISSDISGSFTSVSSSFDTRLTNATASIQGLKTDSGSFSTRITNATASIAGLKTDSGSFSTRITNATASIAGLKTDSGSFSTRLTTEEANVDALQTDSGSFSTRITNATASIAGLKTDSGSFSTRITNATASIAGLKTDSGSFSTRITTIETNAGGQALNTTDSPTFAGLTTTGDVVVQGTLTAETYIVSSSVTNMSVQQASGSTIFGDSLDDTHQITGSLSVTGSVTAVSFIGDGSQLTGITSVTTESIQNLKAGIISGSSQLPSGIISGSSQLPSGLVSGSSQIVSISDNAPSNPVQGDLWWKSNDGNMYVYYDGYWVISIDTTTIIPSGTVSGSSQITDVVTQTYVSQSAAAAGFGSSGNFSLLDLETAVVDSNTTSILDITFITDSNGDLIKSSG